MRLFSVLIFILFTSCLPKGQLYDVNTENISIDRQIDPDRKIEKIVAPYRSGMVIEMGEILGTCTQAMLKERNTPESDLGNWVADIVFETGYESFKNNSNISLTNCFTLINKGGLRSSLNDGNITKGNIFEIMPFDNEIVILKLAPKKMRSIIDYLLTQKGQPVSNSIFYFSEGNDTVEIGNKTYDHQEPFYVITSDYLAKGGDKMNFFLEPMDYYQTGILIRDAMIHHVKTNKEINPPENFGRILFRE